MTPSKADRIIIRNIPPDYRYADLYGTAMAKEYSEDAHMEIFYLFPPSDFLTGIGVIDTTYDKWTKDDSVYFLTGYDPYMYNGEFSCSGGGHKAPRDKVRFIQRCPARFWRFKNNERKAHNSETYYGTVQYFEVDFKDLR